MPLLIPAIRDRSILVTGAAGFLGGVTLSFLRKLGARAVGLSRIPHSGVSSPAVSVDLLDLKSFAALDAAGPFDTVVHCAAVLPVKTNDCELLNANTTMTFNILQWALKANTRYFCFFSGCNVYGSQAKPCREDTLPAPDDIYAISKLSCEFVVRLLFPKACLLRISAPFGPQLQTETVIKRFLIQASRNQPISIMGKGSREQHFVYEEDVARAVSMAIEKEVTGTFNISGDAPVSMGDLANSVLRIFGREGRNDVQFTGVDPQESYRGNFPSDAAKETFGYSPQISLEEGLRSCARAWGLV